LKFVLYAILILFILRKVGGFLFRSWVSKAVEEQQKYAQQRDYGQSRPNEERRNNGEIFISSDKSSKDAKSDKIGGDYVDYEEIK
jgi:hypothetical protein